MKNLFAFALVVLALLGTTVYYAVQAHSARGERDEAQKALVLAQKRITTIQSQVQKSTTAWQKAKQELKGRLDEEPEFRDTAVPVPVRDSLCERIRCK